MSFGAAVLLACLQTATGSVRGVVVDARDGTPLARVSVRIQSSGATVVTGADGTFDFPSVAAGDQELYISAVDFALQRRSIVVEAGGAAEVAIALSPGTGAYSEEITVVGGGEGGRREPAVAGEQSLGRRELDQLRGLLTNDPFRAVQTLPGVATGDDFRSEFSVRGAGVDAMTFTFEGIATPFLVHTVQQTRETGSVAMLNGDVLSDVTLDAGAFPQRYGNRLGAELDFRMREGSRAAREGHVSVSAADASGVAEGPLGSAHRGSWLVSARKSYLDLLIRRLYPNQELGFGFADAQAKIVYDVTNRQQVQFALTAGTSELNRQPEQLQDGDLRTADNTSAIGVFTWRYAPSPSLLITNRIAVTANTFRNTSRIGPELDSGRSHDVVERADASYTVGARLAVEAGGELRRSRASLVEHRLSAAQFLLRDSFGDAATRLGGYAQVRLGAADGRRLVSGIRVDRGALTEETTASPWLIGAWPLGSLTLRAGASAAHQEPEFAEVAGVHGGRSLEPARAYDVDAGIEGRLSHGARWQMTAYAREDRGLFRLPNGEVRLVRGFASGPSPFTRYVNALDGYGRGVEWLIERRSSNGLSGWASYALGWTRDHDTTTGEAFWGDFDQRHTVNAYGGYRLTDHLSAGARLRAGSGVPAAGYWRESDGVVFLAAERNTLRVPSYARVDLRANRTFTWERSRLTVFLEVLNVLNRPNQRVAVPVVDRRTLVVSNMFETMVPLVPSAGILFEF